MWVDLEERNGPPERVWVRARKPSSALRKALEKNNGPGLATMRGRPLLYARKYADGRIEVTEVSK